MITGFKKLIGNEDFKDVNYVGADPSHPPYNILNRSEVRESYLYGTFKN
jgi:hypothetical protein